jgi:hypothetical protein
VRVLAQQRDFAECIQQVSLFGPGREALRANKAVIDALHTLVDVAWTDEAKESAQGSLMQLTDYQREMTASAAALTGLEPHVMMSCASASTYSPFSRCAALCCSVQMMVGMSAAVVVAFGNRSVGGSGGSEADRHRAAASWIHCVV